MAERDRSQLTARTAAASLSILLEGPIPRATLIERTGTSNGTVGRAIAMLRRFSIDVETVGKRNCSYQLKDPDGVRHRLAIAMRLSVGDLMAAGAIAPAAGLGLLIESGAVA